ncbi:MAG: asparagine synthetase B [Methanobrevibacter sp.]|jgi:asparagine synthase (glutamine-hydrolysing)|nr:asparagine synthetase B [Candidatus Methanovirga meridionalis]
MNNKYFLDYDLSHGLKLSFHGEIYNHKEINDFLNSYYNLDYHYNSELFLCLIHFLLNNDLNVVVNSLKENQDYKFVFNHDGTIKSEFNFLIAVLYGSMIINGDFVFSISDGKNTVISRDVIGSYLLYYGGNDELLFANNRKTLLIDGISDIKTFKPGYLLFNKELYPPLNPPWSKINSKNSLNYIESKNTLIKLLRESVNMRIENLDEVGLFFSGGVDSTTIAKILKDNNEIDVKLFTVGTENSKDLEISKKIAKDLDLDLKYGLINEEIIKSEFEDFLSIIDRRNIIDLGVGMTMHLSSKLAVDEGFKTILTGQGADELFGGYNRYLDIYNQDKNSLTDEFRSDIEFMHEVNFQRDLAIANFNNLNFRSPFLDKDFLSFALSLPIDYKIKSSDDKIRKHILRDIAIDLGVPHYIAYRPKKAAQYGSGIHKIIMKNIRNIII